MAALWRPRIYLPGVVTIGRSRLRASRVGCHQTNRGHRERHHTQDSSLVCGMWEGADNMKSILGEDLLHALCIRSRNWSVTYGAIRNKDEVAEGD